MIQQPGSQIKLTNVSVVRLKKGGKRFEIACYKNKVMEWRTKVEKDLDNVLQIQQVFMNVSKGQVASQQDLQKAFKTSEVKDIILQILEKGELQVGEKERNAQLDSVFKDIIHIVTEKTVNPETKRPYTTSMIEKACAEIHLNVNPNKSAKQQALEVIKALQDANTIPISRAQMRVRVLCGSKDAKRLNLKESFAVVEEDEFNGDEYELVGLIDPGQYKRISDLLQKETKGRGQVEVLMLKDVKVTDEILS